MNTLYIIPVGGAPALIGGRFVPGALVGLVLGVGIVTGSLLLFGGGVGIVPLVIGR